MKLFVESIGAIVAGLVKIRIDVVLQKSFSVSWLEKGEIKVGKNPSKDRSRHSG